MNDYHRRHERMRKRNQHFFKVMLGVATVFILAWLLSIGMVAFGVVKDTNATDKSVGQTIGSFMSEMKKSYDEN